MAKAIIIIIDGVGIGKAPDAYKYGDEGSNTLVNLAQDQDGLYLPNLSKMGLGNLDNIKGVPCTDTPIASCGRLTEQSDGKDSTTGHWELAGLAVEQAFPTFTSGFPDEIITDFIEASGVGGILGNIAASGTAIINELGDEHRKTGFPIVYTSADSVFQIATHIETIPLEKLYEICEAARNMLTSERGVARVIARPFTGESGQYYRTIDRKDFSLVPPKDTILNLTQKEGLTVTGIGKIEDLFAFSGLTDSYHTHRNLEGIEKTIEILRKQNEGLVFVNLIDTDMLYGHRNDCPGFKASLEEFDQKLPEILDALHNDDLLFITADHGNDPTMPSTDHSREMVPLIVYGKNYESSDLKIRKSFADLGATIAEFLNTKPTLYGNSFLNLLNTKN